MLVEIVLYEPDGNVRRAKLDPGVPFTVGRSAGQSIYVSDPRVSRKHLVLEPIGGAWFARDPGSANGTFLNGVRVAAAVSVRPGDVLELGDSRAHVIEEDATRKTHQTRSEDITSWDLGALSDALAQSEPSLAARRRKVLQQVEDAPYDTTRPQRLAAVLVEAFSAERLAVFVRSADRLRPLISMPTDDDATTLSSIAARADQERRAVGRRRPRPTSLDSEGGGDTRVLRVLDAFTLAVPAGPCVIALDGQRPAPVQERDEAALLLALGIVMVGSFIQAAVNIAHRSLASRDPESTIHSAPALRLDDMKTADA
jgi:pSer/pThr/pTyr-binding forkhead associated (FHA) protein